MTNRRLETTYPSGKIQNRLKTLILLACAAVLHLSAGQNHALAHGTLTIGAGTLGGQIVGDGVNQITVAPNAPITGSFPLQIHNELAGASIAPIAATPTWGSPSTSYWQVESWAPPGDSVRTVDVDVIAPPITGTYYIVLAMAGTYNSAQLMSGTHPAYAADWVNGNKLALLDAATLETAATQGWIPFNWYTPSGPAVGELAMAVIKVTVSTSSTLTLVSGTLAGQPLSAAANKITVRPGASIKGDLFIRIQNKATQGSTVPVAATPTWGVPASSYWQVSQSAPPGESTAGVQVNLTAPSTEGTYYIVVAMAEANNAEQLMSGTQPGHAANWAIGNNVASLHPGKFEAAARQGWVPFDWYTPTGAVPGEMAMTVVRVSVVSAVVSLTKLVRPSFSNLTPGTSYQLQISTDAKTWANQGDPIIATESTMDHPQSWNVENWQQLLFRLQIAD